jgi:hypothetical protein
MRVVLLLVLALALVPAASSGGKLPPDVEECAPGDVERVIGRFITAFNTRNLPALNRVFSPAESFVWFTTGPPGKRYPPLAYSRPTLLTYFRARHRAGERLRLLELKTNGNSNGYGHFQFLLERRARTLEPTVFQGKGAALCATSGDTIAVWSVGS